MDDQERRRRHQAIAEAAYVQLAAHGYGGTSMLKIAKAARASNETLYRWYGDKDGLLAEMVRDNAQTARQILIEAIDGQGEAGGALERLAPVLLGMVLSEHAIALNRAAAAEPGGRLGRLISEGGREQILPLLAQVMGPLCAGKGIEPAQAATWFVSLLIGDLQTRRIINDLPQLTDNEIAVRCQAACAGLARLLG